MQLAQLSFKSRKFLLSMMMGVLVIILLFSTHSTLFAQSNQSDSPVSLLFSPPLVELALDPGESYIQNVKLENRSSVVQTYYPSVLDFVPQGETGGQRYLDESEVDLNSALSTWVELDRSPVVLSPGEKALVTFTIDVPATAEPGGKYATVFFSTSPETPMTDTVGALISTQTGPLVLIRVAGDALELAELVEFSTDREFYEYPPVNFVVRVENLGTVHVKPVGEIRIVDIFGREVKVLSVNERLANSLPNSIRRFDVEWMEDGFMVGKYTANLSLFYGLDSQELILDQVDFWIVPWKVLLVVTLVLVTIILLGRLMVRKYNQSIINKAISASSSPNNVASGNGNNISTPTMSTTDASSGNVESSDKPAS